MLSWRKSMLMSSAGKSDDFEMDVLSWMPLGKVAIAMI